MQENTQGPLTASMVPMDTNIGISNRLEGEDLEKMMLSTLTDLANILKDHCGPYGKFAAITTISDPGAEPVFTKDGINIMRSVNYVSHVQQFIKHILMYMGSRIETAAGDGTTSAMIIMAVAMRELIKRLKKIDCTYNDLVDVYNVYIKSVFDCDLYGYRADLDNPAIIRYVAHSQAYTSSHGDEELASIIAQLFSTTPKEAWKLFTIEKASYETSKKYEISFSKNQWAVEDCTLFPLSQMSEDFGTASIRHDVRTLMTPYTFAIGDESMLPIKTAIETAIKDNTSLTVIHTGPIDTATNMWLTEQFNTHPNHKISIYSVAPGDYGLWNDIPYMTIASGKELGTLVELTLDYKFDGKDLIITKGLFEDVDTDKCHLHPFFKKAEYTEYNEFIKKLEDQISAQESVVATRHTNNVLAHMRKMLCKLMVVNRSAFHIGGNAYDNAATVDIVADTMQAVKHSLTEGFAKGSNKSMYTVMRNITMHYNNPIVNAIAQSFMTAIREAYNAMFKYGKNARTNITIEYEHPVDILRPQEYEWSKYKTFKDAMTAASEGNAVPPAIIQPINTDRAIISRFGEIALRFVKTERVITEGGAYITQKKDKPSWLNKF